jgi:hypothetical protein
MPVVNDLAATLGEAHAIVIPRTEPPNEVLKDAMTRPCDYSVRVLRNISSMVKKYASISGRKPSL